jgi:lysozyme
MAAKNWNLRALRGPIVLILLLTLTLCAISPTIRYYVVSLLEYPIHYKEYRHFGIKIPSGYALHGIDVSRYQERIDWKRVKEMDVSGTRVQFAFIKATEGTYLVDRYFVRNWADASRQKITRGAYHFFHPNLSPRDQALHFSKTVKLVKGDLPPVVDIEDAKGMSTEQVRKYTGQFLEMLQVRYGVKPIIYTNLDFYKRYFADQQQFKAYPLWIAHYRVNELCLPDNEAWHFWQHNDSGNVNGINADVDFNVFNGDTEDFKRILVP